MKRIATNPSLAAAITGFASSNVHAQPLAHGSGEAHAYLLRFDEHGQIGRHEAGYCQLLAVLSGTGWAEGGDGNRIDLVAGDIVRFERGEQHAKGSYTPMVALMVQVHHLDQTHSS